MWSNEISYTFCLKWSIFVSDTFCEWSVEFFNTLGWSKNVFDTLQWSAIVFDTVSCNWQNGVGKTRKKGSPSLLVKTKRMVSRCHSWPLLGFVIIDHKPLPFVKLGVLVCVFSSSLVFLPFIIR